MWIFATINKRHCHVSKILSCECNYPPIDDYIMYKLCEPQLHYLLPNNVFEDYLCVIFDLSMGIQQTLIENSCGKFIMVCPRTHQKNVTRLLGNIHRSQKYEAY